MGPTVTLGTLDEDRHERARRVGWIDLDRLSSAHVLVVGAGALGNEAVKNLVLSGVHEITIVDMDKVVRSNLSRCLFFTEEDARRREPKAEVLARRARAMDPEAKVEAVVSKVEDVREGVFQTSNL
ncbi:MAG: ThiF family adenylyltransferase, partial [Methanomassiliicoccales archaeon]|nr:ThiF family adenylyltransferase [Methanomassiliicoccales archaeon]